MPITPLPKLLSPASPHEAGANPLLLWKIGHHGKMQEIFVDHVQTVVTHLVNHLIHDVWKSECFGCKLNHLNQTHHSCVYPIPETYFQDNYDKLMLKLRSHRLPRIVYRFLESNNVPDISIRKVETAIMTYLNILKKAENIHPIIERLYEKIMGDWFKNATLNVALETWTSCRKEEEEWAKLPDDGLECDCDCGNIWTLENDGVYEKKYFELLETLLIHLTAHLVQHAFIEDEGRGCKSHHLMHVWLKPIPPSYYRDNFDKLMEMLWNSKLEYLMKIFLDANGVKPCPEGAAEIILHSFKQVEDINILIDKSYENFSAKCMKNGTLNAALDTWISTRGKNVK